MRIGVSVPLDEIGHDLKAVRAYVAAAEDLGYAHVRVIDHVLGADPAHHKDIPVLHYTHESYQHEPLTLLAYLAGVTQRVELVTAVLVLPQRQTALVAKQAAEIDVLSGGRLRLGVGLGWNPVEFQALNERFQNRARRIEEQVVLMRRLWSERVVKFTGEWHNVDHAGLLPLPTRRSIPIWFGSGTVRSPHPPEAVMQRIARLGDGWFPLFKPTDEGRKVIEQVRGYVQAAGRDPAALGIEGRVMLPGGTPSQWMVEARQWRTLGSSHFSVGTGRGGLAGIGDHLKLLEEFSRAAGLSNGTSREV